MPAFSKANFISSLPVVSATRRFSEDSERAGQLVHPSLGQLRKPPTRSEHVVAILAHSRGELGTGCSRVASGKRCEFSETVVLMNLLKGARVVGKCTNCHFSCDSKAQCGAVPANASPALDVSSMGAHLGYSKLTSTQVAVQAEGSAEDMERAEEPQYFALPGHMRDWVAQQELQNSPPRTRAEFTVENVEAVPTFSEHSFEVPSDNMSFSDPVSSSELEAGEEDRKAAEKESRDATLRIFQIREQALRRANEIGLDRALKEVEAERKEYLASVKNVRRK